MRKYMLRPWQGAVLVLACWASGAWASDTLTLVNAGAYADMGGVYTSPYGITINSSSTPTLLICDDFTTDISLGQVWYANVTSLTTVNSGDVAGLKFGTDTDAAEDYATAAVLAAELLTLPNVGTAAENTEEAGEISYALWSVFDPGLLTDLESPGAPTGYGNLTSTEVTAVLGYLSGAESLVAAATTGGMVNLSDISINGQSIGSMTVYTPDGGPGYPLGSNPLDSSQEFITVSMPEPSYPAVLGLDLLAAAGLFVVFRRRSSKTVS